MCSVSILGSAYLRLRYPLTELRTDTRRFLAWQAVIYEESGKIEDEYMAVLPLRRSCDIYARGYGRVRRMEVCVNKEAVGGKYREAGGRLSGYEEGLWRRSRRDFALISKVVLLATK